uniref:Putative N-acetylneuraminate synthase n=1 Tax=viral metagenome TaxID=1070528 RepID=A0A6M3KTL1_9ZZZZ
MVEVVAELGINANGSVETAKKMIDVAYAAGIDYVKFQKRTVDLVYTKKELDAPRESPWGTTTREQKQGLELDWSDYDIIDEYCDLKGIGWFASPWDVESLRFIASFDIPFIKIPSALLTNHKLLEACKFLDRKVILSNGMSTMQELKKAVKIIGEDNIHAILHCTSTYPTAPTEMNLSHIKELKQIFPATKIGFSNHYPGLMGMIMAAVMGAEMIEFHLTLDRSMYGSDQAASIEPHGVFELMNRLKLIEKMKGDGVKQVYDSEIPIMQKLRRQ